jgi:outer membrane murein-binding lipoprotein Lpp
MPTCPHCGQEIESPRSPPAPWWRFDLTRQGINLGCSSLILIAIIVAMCSGGGGFSPGIGRLDGDIRKLENKIDELDKKIDKLREREQKAGGQQP